MTVVTRFAPSPTGFLHIGGARTALFNWLYARHCRGRFLLRIEDTDRERSTDAAIDAILDGLRWLRLDWDGEVGFQSRRARRHGDVARALLDDGKAYLCFCTAEELARMRETARAERRPMRYDGRWRDRDPADAPPGVDPVIRLKTPREGDTVVPDRVQGEVTFANAQLDDPVLLRSDGTPTYMLAVVVDDRDMGVTHVIRGDDHLTNAARQTRIFRALGWPPPVFAHVPLIHGPDGAKLSKRHGALGAEAYRDMGFLPEALKNYLLRLGWSHGDDEIIGLDRAVDWFDLDGIGRSPARFDVTKLGALNRHYLKQADGARLARLAAPHLERRLGRRLREAERARLEAAMPSLRERSRTLVELAEGCEFYFLERPVVPDRKAAKLLDAPARERIAALCRDFAALPEWSAAALEAAVRGFAETRGLGLGRVAQPLRAALTGRAVSPPVFDVMAVFGREESLARLRDATPSEPL